MVWPALEATATTAAEDQKGEGGPGGVALPKRKPKKANAQLIGL